jgi:DNA-binding transcriptional ArsR family regulator
MIKAIIEEEVCITDLETLKVISDPLRVQILEHVGLASDSGELITVKQLSEDLDIPQTKLYYHVKLLEAHDLIRVVETRVVSGIIEKHYQIRARRIRVDLDISKNTELDRDEGVTLSLNSISTMLNTAYKNIEKSFQHRLSSDDLIDDQTIPMLSTQAIMQLSPERAKLLIQRLDDLIAEFSKVDQPGGLPYSLTVLFNPNYHLATHQRGRTTHPRDLQGALLGKDTTSDRIPPQL